MRASSLSLLCLAACLTSEAHATLTPLAAADPIPLEHWPFAPHSGPGEPTLLVHRLRVEGSAPSVGELE